MKKLALLVAAGIVMAACGEAPTAPDAAKKAPSASASHDDIFCESGYILAYDENGNPICIPDPNGDGGNSVNSPNNRTGGNNGLASSRPPVP